MPKLDYCDLKLYLAHTLQPSLSTVGWRPVAAMVFFLYGISSFAADVAIGHRSAKPRIIATTDGEIDDRCSMIRFLLYANEWDIRGVIHSSSKYHWKGNEKHPEKDWEPVTWLDRQLDAYAEVHQNLRLHDAIFPTPDYLRSQVFVGNIAFEGDMSADTPGSDRIVEVLLNPDESPVWLQAWGGSNTIARALKTIQNKHPERVDEVARKARIYLITEQDDTFKNYIRPEWPEIQVLRSSGSSFGAIAYHWKKIQPKQIQPYFERPWMLEHILQGHGPLCEMYEAKEGRFRSEGDTPAFLHVIHTGLRSHQHPTWGGWGGRFARLHGVWKSVDKKDSTIHSILRWAVDFQNDWAARADWCVKSFEQANHPPQIPLGGQVEIEARSNESISLNAGDSRDPDGDSLSFSWWHYQEASSYRDNLPIENAMQAEAKALVPKDAQAGDKIHLVCRVSDNGTPPLARYQRVIVNVTE